MAVVTRGRTWPGAPERWGPPTGHPNEAARNRIVYRQMSSALAYAAKHYARGRLLDIGCGTKPWRATFAPHVREHLGADYAGTLHGLGAVDLICGAYDVPLPDDAVDTVLMTEVLEHLETPADALAEAFRLLTPGGHLIATTPFSWPLHEEPRDFYRYTPYGLRHLAGAAGFEVVEIQPLSGLWTTVALHIGHGLQPHRRRAPRAVDAASVALQRAAFEWERRRRQDRLSWNHLLVARVPVR
jgi:SAM-dependent methyltransferase